MTETKHFLGPAEAKLERWMAAVDRQLAGLNSAKATGYTDTAVGYDEGLVGVSETDWSFSAVPGPSVEVEVTSGKLVIFITVVAIAEPGESLFVGFELSDGNVVLGNEADAVIVPDSALATWSGSFMVEGLESETTTVTLIYKVSGGTGLLARRRLIVMPI